MILREDLALKLLEIGAIKFGAFRLKLHEKNPDAPLSPIYLNLRTPPKGPLPDMLVKELGGNLLYSIAFMKGLSYHAVAGVPEAGNPFAKAFAAAARVKQFRLAKEEGEGWRRVIFPRDVLEVETFRVRVGDRVLLIDDLVTQADSKLEAKAALRNADFAVKDILVIVDREQGGREALARVGITLHAAWQLTGLLEFYRDSRLISDQKYAETIAYLMENRS